MVCNGIVIGGIGKGRNTVRGGGLEDEGSLICGFKEKNSGLSLLCKEEGMEISGNKLKALCSSSKANGQSTNLTAIAKHWS